MIDRLVIKQGMVDLRRVLRGACWCDLCGNELGWDMHEWMTRQSTQNALWLRELSFQPEICSILCNGCHEHIATTPEGIERLIECNTNLYGFAAVKQAIYRIPQIFWPMTVAQVWRKLYAS